jgi:hypothetical protein
MERIRKVDVEKLSDQDLKNVEDMISKKMKEITEKAIVEANRYLNVYGYEAIMAIQFKPKEEESLE